MNTKFNQIFKSNSHASLAIIAGVLLSVVYKFWKWHLENNLGLSAETDYYTYQQYLTYFRYGAMVLTIILCSILYKNKNYIWKIQKKKILMVMIAFPLIFFFLKFSILGYNFSYSTPFDHFLFELPVNFAVGFWEEFVFRGLILAGICRFSNFKWGILISSAYFSVWHYDVVSGPGDYLFIFIMSIIFSAYFLLRIPLILISLCHFIWDQIHFGLAWNQNNVEMYEFSLNTFIVLLAIFLLARVRKNEGCNNL